LGEVVVRSLMCKLEKFVEAEGFDKTHTATWPGEKTN
jgi:hypothetical protein